MRTICLIAVLFFMSLPMYAASVEFNHLTFSGGPAFFDGEYTWTDYSWGEPYFAFSARTEAQTVVLKATYGVFMEYAYGIAEVEKGTVVDTADGSYWGFCHVVGDNGQGGNDLAIPLGETTYLAYTVAYGNPMTGAYPDPSSPSRCGWVELKAEEDGNLVLVRDAMSWGDPLVVGAIPEPGGGLLLRIGGAMLALRRRR